jgi:hypothetical protein
MDVMHIHIDELVLDGFAPNAADLPTHVSEQVSAALVERGLPPHTATNVSSAIGAQVARSVGQ